MKPISILFFSHYLNLHGANKSLLNLILGLRQLGVESYVVAPKGEGALLPELKKNNIPFLQVPLQYSFSRQKKGRLKKLIQHIFALTELYLQLRKVKINFDLVYSNSSVIFLGFLYSKLIQKPHFWHVREFGEKDYHLSPDWGVSLQNFMFRHSAKVIAVSKAVKNEVLKNIPHAIVVYNGVFSESELSKVYELERCVSTSLKQDDFIFLQVGQISHSKNQKCAIEAFSQIAAFFPKSQLWLVGTGSEKTIQGLKNLCMQFGIQEKVIFHGHTPDPTPYYLKADVTLMCSNHEAMGRVTAESLLLGKPVIGNNSGGTPELIQDQLTGLIYQVNATSLAEKMRFCLENPDWLKQASLHAKKEALQYFTQECYAKKIHTLIKRQLHGKT